MFRFVHANFKKHSHNSLVPLNPNIAEFSKNFLEKKKKIQNYLSQEKEEYKYTLNHLKSRHKEYIKNKSSTVEGDNISHTEEKTNTFNPKIHNTKKLLKKNSLDIVKNHSYLFYNNKVQSFLLENYAIIPNLLVPSVINKFNHETKININYKNYLDDWQNKNEHQKDYLIFNEKLKFTDFQISEYKFYKPIFDLFVYFISCNYNNELESLRFLSTLSDMTMPHNWFPQARATNRKIIYHMGPTNSGKTHQAIQALISARTGIYCAPIRLLACEIQEKLASNKIKCALKTGQEIIEIPNATHLSCTIEICPTTMEFDCAVIDEIQLIDDPQRGNAWTNAFLGINAKEIHLCGDERALSLIYQLCQLTGDSLVKKSYPRLSKLIVEEEPVHSVSQLKKGDCIITFSRKGIYKIKKIINEKLFSAKDINPIEDRNDYIKNKCAIIYGSLPPDIKKEQANLFNKGLDGIKYLVATDAIGMGLNLNIKRIIFSEIQKVGDEGLKKLTQFQVRQISGRAGRNKNTGYVTAFDKKDLNYIRHCCARKYYREKGQIQETVLIKYEDKSTRNLVDSENMRPETETSFTDSESKITKACLFPSLQTIIEFAEALRKFKQRKNKNSQNENEFENQTKTEDNEKVCISLTDTLKQFEILAKISDMYFIRSLKKFLEIHKIIENFKDIDITTQFYFTICPIKISSFTARYLVDYLDQFVYKNVVKLPSDFHLNSEKFNKSSYKLRDLETYENIYNILEIYIWLSYKFETEFIERELAKVLIDRVSKIIDSILKNNEFNILSDLKRENKIILDEESSSDDMRRENKSSTFLH